MSNDAPADGNGGLGRKLDSWKEIATYLGRDVTTVQRWERHEGLPIRRLRHNRSGSVYAYTGDLDAWRLGRERMVQPPVPIPAAPSVRPASALEVGPVIAVVSLAVAVAAGGAVIWQQKQTVEPPATAANLVAVTVFEPRTPGSTDDPLGRRVADQVIRALRQVSTVAAIPSPIPASEVGRGGSRDPSSVGSSRAAALLITGDYYVHGDEVEIQGRIVDANDGRLLFASAPTIASRTATGSIERFGETMAGAVATHFDEFFGGLDVISDPPALDAYREYRAGLELFARDYPKARAHLKRAAELEPSFWLPLAIQYYAHMNLGEPQQAGAVIENLLARRDRLRPAERLFIDFLEALWEARTVEAFRALSDVERIVPRSWGVNYMLIYLSLGLNRPRSVLDLYHRPGFADPPLPMQPVALWRMTAFIDALHLLGDHERELEQAKLVERRAPGDFMVVGLESAALAALQRVEDVTLTIDRGLTTAGDNGDAVTLMVNAAVELRAHGQLQASRAIAARTVSWLKTRPAETADTVPHRLALGAAHYLQDQWDEAAGLFSRLHDEHPNEIQYWGYMGAIAARKGDVAAANEVSAGLGRLRDRSLYGEPTYWRARIAALLGHRQEAVDLLREAFAQGYLFSQLNVHACPDFEVLAADPAFRQLVRPEAPR